MVEVGKSERPQTREHLKRGHKSRRFKTALHQPAVPSFVPLELLSTEASRRYARLMREAYEVARAVDHGRGYGNDSPADLLEGLAEEAELDAYGPTGMVRE